MSLSAMPYKQDEQNERAQISATVQAYIDGFLSRDTNLLRHAFHQDAKLMANNEGNIEATPVTEWFAKIDERRRAGGDLPTAHSKIVGIDQHGDAAIARVHLLFSEYEFTDYLALLKMADGWKITNKIYTSIPCCRAAHPSDV